VFEVGALLAGKYRVDRVIGRGGMGVVVGATHVHLQQPVALKFLLPEMVHHPETVERFVREARASAQLRSEHVCRVADVGAFESGAPYIVMELLDGSDLASLIAHGPMPVQRAADHVLQACVGVAEAHALGIVHRDLKPANLFLTRRPDGTPLIKVLDFGIAKAQGDQSFGLTQTSAMLGSPGYMSPEQLRSPRDVDARSDVWSFGVILYELVSGRPPFTGETLTDIALRITMDPPPPLVGRMPQGFEQLVNRCLTKDRAQRYPDLANLAHALAVYAGPGGWELAGAVSRMLHVSQVAGSGHYGATVHGSGPAVTQRLDPSAESPGGHPAMPTTMGGAASSMVTAPARRRARRVRIGAAAATLAVGAVVFAVALRGGGAPAIPAAPGNAEAPAANHAVRSAASPASAQAASSPSAPPGNAAAPAAVAPSAAAPSATAPSAAAPSAAAPAVAPGNPAGTEVRSPQRPRGTKPPRKEGPRRPPVPRPPEDFGESRF
jgi:hypothetical protein